MEGGGPGSCGSVSCKTKTQKPPVPTKGEHGLGKPWGYSQRSQFLPPESQMERRRGHSQGEDTQKRGGEHFPFGQEIETQRLQKLTHQKETLKSPPTAN